MQVIKLNDRQYRIEGDDAGDLVNVKVGQAFLDSDLRHIAKIEPLEPRGLAYSFLVTVEVSSSSSDLSESSF